MATLAFNDLEHVYMIPEVNSNRVEISNRFEMLFHLHGSLHENFTAATFQAIARLYCTCAQQTFVLMKRYFVFVFRRRLEDLFKTS